jgi:iron complex outermembrane recepter protein
MCPQNYRGVLHAALLGASSAIAIVVSTPAAYAQAGDNRSITVPSMPLDDALRSIEKQSGAKIAFDPDGVRGKMSVPVNGVKGTKLAIEQAIRGSGLAVTFQNGQWDVGNDIVVTAHRDEAETSVLVRDTSTSDRNGTSLREQPRNTQVISAKVIADQQDLSINEALRNAGGVTTSAGSPQSGSSYTVRGFDSGGLVNGLSGAASYGVASGSSQPIANIERIEVLKGPDALLAGFDNLGGNINVVTKKPTADPLLIGSVDTGSYGLIRATIDGSDALTSDKKLSARFIFSEQGMSHDYGGYTGNKDTLIAPSLRFKDSMTDFIIGLSSDRSTTGVTPYAVTDQVNGGLIPLDPFKPFYSPNQAIRVTDTRTYFDFTHKFSDDVTFVSRGMHDNIKLDLDLYGVYYIGGPAIVSVSSNGQTGASNAFDAYFRLNKAFGGVTVKANVGYNFSNGYFEEVASEFSDDLFFPDFTMVQDPTIVPEPLPAAQKQFRLSSQQQGVYGQLMVGFWKLKLLGGLRQNWFWSQFKPEGGTAAPKSRSDALTPNAGVVLDVTSNVSLWANYVEGNSPSSTTDFSGKLLPNIRSTNKEAGVKVDLFNKHITLNLSYFDLLEHNRVITDPAHPGFEESAPGQRSRGIDFNVAGSILPGWIVSSSVVRSNYKLLSPNIYETVVAAQPKWTYSVYSNYSRKLGDGLRGGFGVGLYGRSSSYADNYGEYVVPAARQVDANVFISYKGYDLNVGIRNVFNRLNYNVTSSPSFIPIDEPRNFRVTLTKRFF